MQVASDRQGHLCGRQGEILKVAADLVVKMDKGLKAVVMPIADVVKVDKHALAPTSLTPRFFNHSPTPTPRGPPGLSKTVLLTPPPSPSLEG